MDGSFLVFLSKGDEMEGMWRERNLAVRDGERRGARDDAVFRADVVICVGRIAIKYGGLERRAGRKSGYVEVDRLVGTLIPLF